ncbi:Probable reductase [Leucobacter sp. 7(1)]|nr:Probable reductase [Leucobacter sp. 7(1)]
MNEQQQQPSTPFISINTFTARDGGLDALIQFQIAETQRMSIEATAHGWLGNEMYRTRGGTDLIVITRFRSPEARALWAETPRFLRHVDALQPYVQEITTTAVDFVAAHGAPR